MYLRIRTIINNGEIWFTIQVRSIITEVYKLGTSWEAVDEMAVEVYKRFIETNQT